MTRIGVPTVALFALLTAPSFAQVNMQYSGQYSGLYSGRYDGRVDGRANRSEGLPPSVADRSNYLYDNPVDQNDCNEVNAISPDYRPGWRARILAACQQ
jgi:hypothetical protein